MSCTLSSGANRGCGCRRELPSGPRSKRLLTVMPMPRGKGVAKATTLSRGKWEAKKSKLRSAKGGVGRCSETVNVITEQECIYFP